MYDRDDYGPPERRAATGLPLGVMLLSVLAIAVYLLAGNGASGGQKSGRRGVRRPPGRRRKSDCSA